MRKKQRSYRPTWTIGLTAEQIRYYTEWSNSIKTWTAHFLFELRRGVPVEKAARAPRIYRDTVSR